MARTAKITNANVAPRKNTAGLVGNTPVRAQDFNDLVGDYVSQTAASRMGVIDIKTVTADTTLTASDSGKIISMNPTGIDITLPAVTNKGYEAKFILTASPSSNDIDVVSAEGDNIKGIEFADADTAAATDSDWDKVTFSTNAVAGDYMTVVSDGTSWYAHKFTSADNATTQTD